MAARNNLNWSNNDLTTVRAAVLMHSKEPQRASSLRDALMNTCASVVVMPLSTAACLPLLLLFLLLVALLAWERRASCAFLAK